MIPERRRLLIVSPHFPPVNAADHQRVRHALPHLRAHGWEPEVLAVRPDEVNEVVWEPLLERTYPADIAIHRTGALPLRWTRRVGMGTLGLRCLPTFAAAGARLLKARRFDAVFFSTTQFPVMALGPRWRRRFGVPFFLDFQDPWVSDYHERAPLSRPPGGRWKYRFSQWIARRLEPGAVRGADGIVCVSGGYPPMLRRRYPRVPAARFAVLPFAGSAADYAVTEAAGVRQSVFDPDDGNEHWVYAGRGQQDMERALEGIFAGLRTLAGERPAWAERLRLHFVGTAYAGGVKTIEPVAVRTGVAHWVREQPGRLPYFEVLRCLRDAHGLLLPGSDDPAYTPSKVVPCLLAGPPLLAVLHRASGAGDLVRRAGNAGVVEFNETTAPDALGHEAAAVWRQLLDGRAAPRRPGVMEPHEAAAMTARLAAFFQARLNRGAAEGAAA